MADQVPDAAVAPAAEGGAEDTPMFPAQLEAAESVQQYSAETLKQLEEKKALMKARTERFGGEWKEPKLRTLLGPPSKVATGEKLLTKNDIRALKAGKEAHFVTGFDVFSQENLEAKKKRAERFGIAPEPEKRYGIKEDLDPEELQKRAERAAKYGVPLVEDLNKAEIDAMDTECVVERREPGADVARRWDAIHMYRVDLMTTREVLKFWDDYDPSHVEWLDDSSCNVVFSDIHTARRALHSFGRPIKNSCGTKAAEVDESTPIAPEALIAAQERSAEDDVCWWIGRNFQKQGRNFNILIRFATAVDVRPANAPRTLGLWKPGNKQRNKSRKQQQQQQQKKARVRGNEKEETGWGSEAQWQHDLYDDGGGKVRRNRKKKNDDGGVGGVDLRELIGSGGGAAPLVGDDAPAGGGGDDVPVPVNNSGLTLSTVRGRGKARFQPYETSSGAVKPTQGAAAADGAAAAAAAPVVEGVVAAAMDTRREDE